jgi:crotonobetainyl-CoA:carnitine CoA-transferase CaiB-like acyl-CoA transferase
LGDEINPHLREFVKQYKKEELFHRLQDKAIAAAPVNTAEDLVKSPQTEARGFFADVDHPKAGRLKHPTAPYKLSRTPWRAERAAPLLGQHNELVYCDRLGYDKLDLVKMKETGVI